MSLRVKNTRLKTKTVSDHLVKTQTVTEDDKENRSSSNQRLKRKNISDKSAETQNRGAKPEEPDSPLSSKAEPEMKFSCRGFWSKKLQDLESSKKKNKKSELYDFSCTEESDASYKVKKKPKRKKQQLKKRKPAEVKYKKPLKSTNKVLQTKENIHKQPLHKKEKLIKKERKILTDEDKNLTLPSGTQSVAFTSTPAVNKTNLVDPSNFLFLSPIIKEQAKYSNGVNGDLSIKLNNDNRQNVTNFDQETPKIQTRLRRISCRRVLRSGKMLNK